MLDKLKTDLDEMLALVKKCPNDLQEVALKTLLEHWLRTNAAPPAPPIPMPGILSPAPAPHPHPVATSLPANFQPFMMANSLTEAHLQRVYHPLGAGAQLIVSSIPGTGKSGQQVSLALLIAVRQAMATGTFICALEDLRQMCLHYNCYDSANFAATLKNNSTLFKGRKKGEDLELSAPGMKRAAEIIKKISAPDA